MAIVSVSDASELKKALDSASRGDKIVLDPGNYGTLSLNGSSRKADYKFDDITITSKSGSKPAVFSEVNLANVTNVTFDGIRFEADGGNGKPFLFNKTTGISILNSEIEGRTSGGYGTGHGLWVIESADFRLENSEIRDFATGAHFRSVDDLEVVDNSLSGISYDGMLLARIDGVLIEGNRIEMNGKAGTAHRDMIQFWNRDSNHPSEDIVIRDNTLIAGETVTHGIYIANDVAHRGGGLDSFYSDVVIENNTIKSGQVMGILVGQTADLTIRGNTVLQHAAVDSTRPVDIPVIRVEDSSRDVSITGNVTHRTPEAVSSGNNWQSEGKSSPGGWTISGNRIVALGTDADTGSSKGGSVAKPAAPAAPEAPATPDDGAEGNGKADNFRFLGSKVDGKTSVTFQGVDFGEGDRILLQDFDKGTFLDFAGGSGNKVLNNAAKTYVRIDSLTDIQEIVTASKELSASFQKDVLQLKIAQDDGTLTISLPGLADDYKSTFDDSLF